MIKCGIPQGSILRPLFFLLYINDLPQCLSKTKPRSFADDTNLTASGDTIPHLETAVNSDLENLRKWLKEQCHISRIFSFSFFLPFYKLLMDSVELKHINCITFTLFYIQRQQIAAKSLSLQRLHPASIFSFFHA